MHKIHNITGHHITNGLAIRPLKKALASQPSSKDGLILHSNQGSLYTSKAFIEFCESANAKHRRSVVNSTIF